MNVADFKTGTFAVQATRAQSGQTPLMIELTERVGLVDDLGEFAATKEIINGGRNTLGVDQLGDATHFLGIGQAHTLLDGAAEL